MATSENNVTRIEQKPSLDTNLCNGGEASRDLMVSASSEISDLADELLQQINEVDVDTDTSKPCAVMRALTMRVAALNSLTMSYFTDEDLPLHRAYSSLYGRHVGEKFLGGAIAAEVAHG